MRSMSACLPVKMLPVSALVSFSCLPLRQVENEDLVFTLETLVERFGEDMAPYAVGLTQHLAAAFWRMQVTT